MGGMTPSPQPSLSRERGEEVNIDVYFSVGNVSCNQQKELVNIIIQISYAICQAS